jgi:hypothetical protein
MEEWLGYSSLWEMVVWDCRGVIRPTKHLLRIWPDVEEKFEYVDVGYFKVPIPLEFVNKLTPKLLKKIEKWCWRVLQEQGGAINWSGIYPISDKALEELSAILFKYSRR